MLEADMRKENQPAHLGSGAVRVILASPCCLIHRFPDHKKYFLKKVEGARGQVNGVSGAAGTLCSSDDCIALKLGGFNGQLAALYRSGDS